MRQAQNIRNLYDFDPVEHEDRIVIFFFTFGACHVLHYIRMVREPSLCLTKRINVKLQMKYSHNSLTNDQMTNLRKGYRWCERPHGLAGQRNVHRCALCDGLGNLPVRVFHQHLQESQICCESTTIQWAVLHSPGAVLHFPQVHWHGHMCDWVVWHGMVLCGRQQPLLQNNG